MIINKKKFFDGLRDFIGGLSTAQVLSLNYLLKRIDTDGFEDIQDLSYILATIYHETAHTFRPIEEYGKGKGRSYGIPDKVTGQTYYGRGYVQLTWKANYEYFDKRLGKDLVKTPALALDPDISWWIITIGMAEGKFTGKKLDDFRKNGVLDYVGARRIVNGTDRAQLIASYATKFEQILKESIDE